MLDLHQYHMIVTSESAKLYGNKDYQWILAQLIIVIPCAFTVINTIDLSFTQRYWEIYGSECNVDTLYSALLWTNLRII